jgi:hypothetical protein
LHGINSTLSVSAEGNKPPSVAWVAEEPSQRDAGANVSNTTPVSADKKGPSEGGMVPEPTSSDLAQKPVAGSEELITVSSRGPSTGQNLGLRVCLRDLEWKEVAIGFICQVDGSWQGRNLKEQNLCVILVTEFKVDKTTKLPYPSNLTGTSFEEAETLQGNIKVAWSNDKLTIVPYSKTK